MYVLTIKNAFKVDYGSKFVRLFQGGLKEYEPANDEEVEQIKKY